jgi:hypothetical protein
MGYYQKEYTIRKIKGKTFKIYKKNGKIIKEEVTHFKYQDKPLGKGLKMDKSMRVKFF